MAQAEKFFDAPVDRTPYGACVWLAVLIGITAGLGASLLWEGASYVKQHRWLEFRLPGIPHPTAPDLGNEVQKSLQSAGTQAKQAGEQAVQGAAQNAASAAATAATQAVQNQAKQQAQSLQQYLK